MGQVLEELWEELNVAERKVHAISRELTETRQHSYFMQSGRLGPCRTTPSGWSCFLGIKFTDGGIDMEGMRNPAGSVSIEPAIIPSPAPPSRALNLLRHDGERRKDLSSPLYTDEAKREVRQLVSFLQCCVRSKPQLKLSPPPGDGQSPRLAGC